MRSFMRQTIITLIFSLLAVAVANAQSENPGREILSPALQDAAEAEREGFKVFKILPRGIYASEKNELGLRGGAAYYSFVEQSHSYNDTPQLGLEKNYLKVGFYGASYGLIADLGLVSLSGVTVESEEVKFLADYKPPTVEAEIRAEQRKAYEYDTEKATYRSRVQVSIGHSYALRAISFDEADTLVAFQIRRKNPDGSLIIFWKMLKQFPRPVFARADENVLPDPGLEEKIQKALRAKGFYDLIIDVSTKPITVRGTYPKDKIADVMQTVMEANGGKPVRNEAAGK